AASPVGPVPVEMRVSNCDVEACCIKPKPWADVLIRLNVFDMHPINKRELSSSSDVFGFDMPFAIVLIGAIHACPSWIHYAQIVPTNLGVGDSNIAQEFDLAGVGYRSSGKRSLPHSRADSV